MTLSRNLSDLANNVNTSGTLGVAGGGSGVTTSTGSGNLVLSNSPTLVTPALGTPASGTLTSCTGLPLTTGVTGTLPIANGGTGQTTASAAFNALSPITTAGDLILGNGANSATRLAIGSNNTYLKSDGTTASWSTVSAGAMTLISTQTASGSAISWTGLTGTKYLLVFDGVYGGGGSPTPYASLRFGYGATPTYLTSSYYTSFLTISGSNAVYVNSTANSLCQMGIMSTSSAFTDSGFAYITYNAATSDAGAIGEIFYTEGPRITPFTGMHRTMPSALTAIQVLADSGGLIGTFSLYQLSV